MVIGKILKTGPDNEPVKYMSKIYESRFNVI